MEKQELITNHFFLIKIIILDLIFYGMEQQGFLTTSAEIYLIEAVGIMTGIVYDILRPS